jgi:ketosteroid isomerase-like protein
MTLSESLLARLEIEAMLADYWHDVDHEWGHNAHLFYTQDGVFQNSVGRARAGHEEIKDFYNGRHARGARISRHLVSNLRVVCTGPGQATASWVLSLIASDGEPVLPSEPPILVADVVDCCERGPDGRWLIAHRNISALFKGEKPTTV